MGDFNYFLPIEKVDEERRMVWGYASTPTKDLQGEIVTLDAIKSALPDYMKWANIREMHTSSAVGVTKEAHIDDNGLYIGARIVDDDAWKKCKEQVYKGFSIGGSKIQKAGDTIKELRLTEISLVDRPANPDCKIEVVKAAGVLPLVAPEGAGFAQMFDKFLDICKGMMHPGAARDGFQLPARSVETPAHAALEGHQPNVIPLRVDNADKHPSSAMQTDLRQPGAETPGAQRMAEVELEKRDFSEKERKHLASQGLALPDGSYPIKTEADLKNAVQAYGRAGDKPEAKAHIIARAKAMKLTHLLPADWPGSTKEEKSAMDQDLQKRLAASHKASLAKAHEHLQKAIACHGRACEAHNNLAKCMGKADGAGEQSTHLKSLSAALSQMGDHHDIAMHHLSKAAAAWTGESKETPSNTEGGDVTTANAGTIDLLPQHHLTEGSVSGSSYMGAGDSPYSAAAIAAEVQKAVAAVTRPLQEKLAETEKELAFQKGQMAVLERMPSGGPRPRLMTGAGSSLPGFDVLGATDPKAAVNSEISKAVQSIDPNDPNTSIQAAARVIGLRALNPELFGKHITDPSYRGGAGK